MGFRDGHGRAQSIQRIQEGNDPKHNSRVAQEFISREVPEIIDWPSNSPDLNQVENLWSIMKRRVEKRKPTDIEGLDRFSHEKRENIDLEIINNLINSMQTRCLAVIESKGEKINY